MNSSNRMDSLKAILAQDPRHGFARYGLAMEYANTGDLDQAVVEFHTLLENDPNYAAAYYHGGHSLEKLGRLDEARALYEKGIQVTTRTGDAHTRAELQAALDMLPI
jgi:tetratricopeptide (TPR) repeat protein